MIDFIMGDVVSIKDDYILLQNNGIGYKINTSVNTMMNLELGKKEQLIYTQLIVREDGLYLYGFSTEEEMEMFKLLIMVTKVGPKVALGILSSLSTNQIQLAIMNNNIDKLCKAPGVGRKTAERIILELKDRINKEILIEEEVEDNPNNNYQETVQALMNLGYTRYEVDKAVRSLDKSISVEDMIREGLRVLSKH
ncbi:Holliday junction branch migration protein RuvA [Paratissierella segnis]|jgi:Holliday junction DNA helicase RuvA|uniref:Holliday junction branch migration complex subunit RuvA n=1 Tax=Paratissierella segnis TaxID=2763679 RepID=A0A926EYF4_9FIRM|nr:Holliday junction branch migration protein RuvA [Paratissierella segnis]MBC8588694.1 Holliday junction branch migration protein RuvA [Paratissierella segnis]